MRADHTILYRKILLFISFFISKLSLTKILEGLLNKALLNLLTPSQQTRLVWSYLIHSLVHAITHSLIHLCILSFILQILKYKLYAWNCAKFEHPETKCDLCPLIRTDSTRQGSNLTVPHSCWNPRRPISSSTFLAHYSDYRYLGFDP